MSEIAKNSDTQSLKLLARRMIDLQEEERRHLARELHDEIGQVLNAVRVNLRSIDVAHDSGTASRLNDSIRNLDHAIHRLRNLSLELRPTMLDDLGLISTLRWYADRQSQVGGFISNFVATTSGEPLPPCLTITIYRVAQESLTNVLKHAQAKNVWLVVRQSDEELSLSIRDDGVGFEISKRRQQSQTQSKLGLQGMQERIELLGGGFRVESHPRKGTTIQVSFQLPKI